MNTIEQQLETESIAITSTAIWTLDDNIVTLHPTCGGSYSVEAETLSEAIDAARILFRESIISRLLNR